MPPVGGVVAGASPKGGRREAPARARSCRSPPDRGRASQPVEQRPEALLVRRAAAGCLPTRQPGLPDDAAVRGDERIAIPPTVGELGSQVGSCTTTGVTSHARACSPTQWRDRGRRGTPRRRTRTSPSAGASYAARPRGARAEVGARPPFLEHVDPRGAGAAGDQVGDGVDSRGLVEPRERRRVERHRGRGSATTATWRASSARCSRTTSSSRSERRREAGRGAPVDRRTVARPVGARPASSAPWPRRGSEHAPRLPANRRRRDERERRRAGLTPRPRGSGRGARSRQRRRIPSTSSARGRRPERLGAGDDAVAERRAGRAARCPPGTT